MPGALAWVGREAGALELYPKRPAARDEELPVRPTPISLEVELQRRHAQEVGSGHHGILAGLLQQAPGH